MRDKFVPKLSHRQLTDSFARKKPCSFWQRNLDRCCSGPLCSGFLFEFKLGEVALRGRDPSTLCRNADDCVGADGLSTSCGAQVSKLLRLLPAGSSPRLAGSENSRRKVSDRWFYPALDSAVRPLRAATTWLDDARQASSNHLLLSRKVERGPTELGIKPWLSVAEAATWPMTMSMEGVPVRQTCSVRLR